MAGVKRARIARRNVVQISAQIPPDQVTKAQGILDDTFGLESGEVPRQGGSDLEAARDVLMGDEKSMTYVPTREMSEQAADLAVAFLAEVPARGGEEVDGVDSWLFRDQEVTLDSLTTVLVGQHVLTLDELCRGGTAKRCARLGLR